MSLLHPVSYEGFDLRFCLRLHRRHPQIAENSEIIALKYATVVDASGSEAAGWNDVRRRIPEGVSRVLRAQYRDTSVW